MNNNPTPSSEIIHLVRAFGDTLDSLPPSLTRSLSDLKELDAVLANSIATITTKLHHLNQLINHTTTTTTTTTPFQRLVLLRELTECARVFRLGGEDKIRVATATGDAIKLHDQHLATLAKLVTNFIPLHLQSTLPPSTAPHGYSTKGGNETGQTKRFVPAQGDTGRIIAAIGIVKERQPNQYTVKRTLTQLAQGGAQGKRRRNDSPPGNGITAFGINLAGTSMANGGIGSESMGAMGSTILTSRETTSAPQSNSLPHQHPQSHHSLPHTTQPPHYSPPSPPTRVQQSLQPLVAHHHHHQPQHYLPTHSSRRNSPPLSPPLATPHSLITGTPLGSIVGGGAGGGGTGGGDLIFDDVGGEEEGEEEGDGQTYCYCHRVSFGEMIGCDGNECDREWFHLACVGLSSIPKGRWFCEECRATEKNKKRR